MNFADQRVLKSAPATLVGRFVDQDGAALAVTAPVNVVVTKSDGTTLVASTPASVGAGEYGSYTTPLTAVQTATLDYLTATWTATSGEVVVTHVAIVGAYAFTLIDLVSLDGMTGLSPQRQRDLRQAVEEMVEERTGWCWTPRVIVESFPAYGSWGDWFGASPAWLSKRPVRTLRSVRVDGIAQTLGVNGWSSLAYGQISSVSGYTGLTATAQLVTVVYEVGEDRPPVSLVQSLLDAARQNQLDRVKGSSSRVLSQTNEFGNINYARATAENLFGNPAVDAVLALWDRRIPAIA